MEKYRVRLTRDGQDLSYFILYATDVDDAVAQAKAICADRKERILRTKIPSTIWTA